MSYRAALGIGYAQLGGAAPLVVAFSMMPPGCHSPRFIDAQCLAAVEEEMILFSLASRVTA